jgi:hypothetical protein
MFENEDVLNSYAGKAIRPGAYSLDLRPEDAGLWAKHIQFRIYKIETPLVRIGGSTNGPNPIH